MNRKNRLITMLLIMAFIRFQSCEIYASNNNFFNINIKEENNSLIIKEDWNIILKDNGLFERELALDKECISNLTINQVFPYKATLPYLKKYNESNNTTIIEANTNSKNGESVVLRIEYKLNLDSRTKSNFINSLPYSLSTSNLYNIDKFNLTLDTTEYSYDGNIDFGVNDEFIQTTSKSKTLEVLIQLFKLLINTVIIAAICFICYVITLALYYRNQRNKKKNHQLKSVKSNKKRAASKKKQLLKTRI